MPNGRIKFIDLAKGIGIFLVVMGHSMEPRSAFIYSFHMPLFFLLSGYFYRYESFKTTLLGKINRLLIPFYFFSVLSWCIYLLKIVYISDKDGIISYIMSFGQIIIGLNPDVGNVPLWFLPCLFSTSLLYWGIQKLTTHPVYSSIFVFILSLIGYYAYSLNLENLPFRPEVACSAIVFYHLGYCTNKYNFTDRLRNISIYGFLVLICLLPFIQTFLIYLNTLYSHSHRVNMYSNTLGNYFIFYICALVGIIHIIALSLKINKINIVNWYGKNSLIILAIHFPITNQVIKIYPFLPSVLDNYTKGVIAACITMAICYPFILFFQHCFPKLSGFQSVFIFKKNKTVSKQVLEIS
jgi:acyltransferase